MTVPPVGADLSKWAALLVPYLQQQPVVVTQQAGTQYVLQATDGNTDIEFTNAAGCTVTAPATGLPVGFYCNLRQMGGQVIVVPDTGVTLQSPGGDATGGPVATMSIVQNATRSYVLGGFTT